MISIILAWAQIVFYVVGTAAALAAVWQYVHTDQYRIVETLIMLDERFRQFSAVKRMIDPAFKESAALIAALSPLPGDTKRSEAEILLVMQLDELLSFFLLVCRLHDRTFLRRRELGRMYGYWFRALRTQPVLWNYVDLYYPTVAKSVRRIPGTYLRQVHLDEGI